MAKVEGIDLDSLVTNQSSIVEELKQIMHEKNDLELQLSKKSEDLEEIVHEQKKLYDVVRNLMEPLEEERIRMTPSFGGEVRYSDRGAEDKLTEELNYIGQKLIDA